MTTTRSRRNLITIIIGLLIILPFAIYNAANNKGIFFLLNEAENSEEIYIDLSPFAETRTFGGEELKLVASLRGPWRFATGDDPERALVEFDDSQWEQMPVPANWERHGHQDYDGFAWYRRSFELPEDQLKHTLFLSLGRIDDADEVFVNGERIGGTGQLPPTYESAWNRERDYIIPNRLVHAGSNLVAVRVYDAQQGGGIVEGSAGIYASPIPALLLDLQGDWDFRTEGSADYRPIHVPQIWEEQGYADYDGIAHYRKNFGPLDVNPQEILVLLLGKIDDTDEVFLNGELVGRTGRLNDSDREVDPDYYRIDRRYEFPAALLKDQNTLEVRVHDSVGEGGIYEGPVGIARKADFQG